MEAARTRLRGNVRECLSEYNTMIYSEGEHYASRRTATARLEKTQKEFVADHQNIDVIWKVYVNLFPSSHLVSDSFCQK